MAEEQREGRKKSPAEARKDFLEIRLPELLKEKIKQAEARRKLNEIIRESSESFVLSRRRARDVAQRDQALKELFEELDKLKIPEGDREKCFIESQWRNKRREQKHQLFLRNDIAIQLAGRKVTFTPREIQQMQDFVLQIRTLENKLSIIMADPEKTIDLSYEPGETEEERASRIAREEAQRSGGEKEGEQAQEKQEQVAVTEAEVASGVLKKAGERVASYEAFQGEKMEEGKFRSLVAVVEEALQRRAKELVDEWVALHPDEVKERAFKTGELPASEERKLVLEVEGEGYFNEDPYYRTLAFNLSNLENSDGRPELRTTLFCSSLLDENQRKIETDIRRTPEDASLKAERSRIVGIQEALYKSFYKKDVSFDQARALEEALNDARTTQELNEFFNGIDTNANLLEKQREYDSSLNPSSPRLNPREITALEASGYEIRPIKKRTSWSWIEKQLVDVKVLKDGSEVSVNPADIYRQFEENKAKELAKKYLGEKVENEKIQSLRDAFLEIRNPDELERLSEELERETVAKLYKKMEMVRLKKEDPEMAKQYQEVFKEGGEFVGRKLEATLKGGEHYALFSGFSGKDDEVKALLRSYGRPESYVANISSDDRQTLLKARKGGPLRWVVAVFSFMNKLERLASA